MPSKSNFTWHPPFYGGFFYFCMAYLKYRDVVSHAIHKLSNRNANIHVYNFLLLYVILCATIGKVT